MEISKQKIKSAGTLIAIAAIWLFFGFAIAGAGYKVVSKWSSVGAAYAAVGTLWLLAGPAMFGAALWALASVARPRIPLWVGGTAGLLSGAALIAGVLTYVVPCSGPS